jgi:hypothetical protein
MTSSLQSLCHALDLQLDQHFDRLHLGFESSSTPLGLHLTGRFIDHFTDHSIGHPLDDSPGCDSQDYASQTKFGFSHRLLRSQSWQGSITPIVQCYPLAL